SLIVHIFLDARDALVIDVDEAEDMRGGLAAGIEAALLCAEAETGYAERQDLALLARRKLAAQPDEAGIGAQPVIGLLVIEIRQHPPQLLDRLIHIDDATWLGKER